MINLTGKSILFVGVFFLLANVNESFITNCGAGGKMLQTASHSCPFPGAKVQGLYTPPKLSLSEGPLSGESIQDMIARKLKEKSGDDGEKSDSGGGGGDSIQDIIARSLKEKSTDEAAADTVSVVDLGDISLEEDPFAALDDFYNPDNLEAGEKVKVVAKGVKFWHIPGYKEEGFDPEGCVGEIKEVLRYDRVTGLEIEPDRPALVIFEEPRKFRAHFRFDELKRTEE